MAATQNMHSGCFQRPGQVEEGPGRLRVTRDATSHAAFPSWTMAANALINTPSFIWFWCHADSWDHPLLASIRAHKSSEDDERTEPMVAVCSGARSPSWRCCSTYGSKNEAYSFLRLSVWGSVIARRRSVRHGVTNGRVHAHLRYSSRRIRAKTHLRARIIKAKEGGCYLHPRCPLLPLEDGWRGGAGAGMRSDARGQRHDHCCG